MNKFDLSVYFVVDPSVCRGRSVEDVARAAVRGGATAVQLRDKSGDLARTERQARALKHMLAGTGVKLIVNDHVEIAARVGADGAHIGQDDISPQKAREMMGPKAVVGLTAFTPGHFAAIDPDVVDYAGTGPFFPTLTKPDKPVLGAEKFHALAARSPVPVVGIGGITPGNAGDVIRAGADGVAMMRAISEADDPEKAARDFVLAVRQARLEAAS